MAPIPKRHEAENRGLPSIFVLVSATAWSLFYGAWLVVRHPQMANRMDWLIVRASGITAFVLLTAVVGLGLVMANARNKEQWHLTGTLIPWHRSLSMITLSFLLAHLTFLALDAQSGFGIKELLVPFTGDYRPFAVAAGIASFYLLLITWGTAHFPRLFPNLSWLKIHRLAATTWIAAWFHGVLAGTDTPAFYRLYEITGILIAALLFCRYWILPRRTGSPQERRTVQ